MLLAIVLRLGERLSPRPNAIFGRLPILLCLLLSESAVSGGTAVLVLLLLKPPASADGIKEKRLDVLLLPSLLVFLRLNENEVRLDSVERLGSCASIGIGLMLTGGRDRGGFSFGVCVFSVLSLLPKMDPRLPNSSPSVLERLCPRLLDALLLGSFEYGPEVFEL